MSQGLSEYNPAAECRGNLPSCVDDRVLSIGQTANGHGMRGISGRKVFGSASVTMPKTDCPMLTEALGEHIQIKRHLFNPTVVSVWAQPYRVNLLLNGTHLAFFPDTALLMSDGSRIVEEHKGSARQLRDPVYRAKVALAEVEFRARGFGFRFVLGDGSHLDPWERRLQVVRDDNVERMFPSRYVEFTDRQERSVANLLRRQNGHSTLGHISAVLDQRQPHGRAFAYSMAARRLLDIDLDRPLSDSTIVRSVPPLPPNMPSLRL